MQSRSPGGRDPAPAVDARRLSNSVWRLLIHLVHGSSATADWTGFRCSRDRPRSLVVAGWAPACLRPQCTWRKSRGNRISASLCDAGGWNGRSTLATEAKLSSACHCCPAIATHVLPEGAAWDSCGSRIFYRVDWNNRLSAHSTSSTERAVSSATTHSVGGSRRSTECARVAFNDH
jgi:hypothetical protein